MEDESTKAIYGKGAEVYEEVMRKYWHVERKPLIEHLKLKSGMKVLNAVVGTGLDLPHFPSGVTVVGVDYTKEMLEEAKQKKCVARVELRRMDIREMDFPNEHFDAALSTFTLCVIPSPKKALQEILRVTKAGSVIVIFDYAKSRNPEIIKWQELIHNHAANMGFPRDVICWNSLMDYDDLIYNSGLPVEVMQDERFESENPFSNACKIILRKRE